MNETIFPTRIDFGKCGVNETKTRVVKLECKVPIQFEFEIIPEVPLENSAELWIHPLEGVVPADGGVEITINFKPLRLVTYNFPLQIRLAQFNSKPIVCTVSGSGFPCLLRDTALKSTVKEAQGIDRCGVFSNTTEELEGLDGAPDATLHRAFGAAAGGVMSTKGKKGGGAGGGDAVTRSKKIKKAVTQNPTVRPPATPPSDEVEVAITGGTVKVPTGSLQTHSTVSYVLLQQPGKLRIKDLKSVIADNQMKQTKRLEMLEGATTKGLGWIDDEEMGHQMKEMIFQKEFSQMVEVEKQKELKTDVARGVDEPTTEELAEHVHMIQAAQEARGRAQRLEATAKFQPVLTKQRAMHFADEPIGNGNEPNFDMYKNNEFRIRAQVMERFVQVVQTVIFRQRAGKRLERIQKFTEEAGHDSEKLYSLLELIDVKAAFPDASTDQEEGAPVVSNLGADLAAERVYEHAFPMYRAANFRVCSEVALGEIDDWETVEPMTLKVPLQYKMVGYQALEFTPISTYVPIMESQPLMQGAEEEECQGPPRGALQDLVLSNIPALFQSPKREPLIPPADRFSTNTVMTPVVPQWGMREDPFRIQPAEYTYMDSVRVEISGSNTVLALPEPPLLSDIWLPRREDWLMEKVSIPALMTGPREDDQMMDDNSVEVHPDAAIEEVKYPTSASIAAEFYIPVHQGSAPAPEGEGAEAAAGIASGEVKPLEAAPAEPVGINNYEIPRQRRELDLDNSKVVGRIERGIEVEKRRDAFNAVVKDPRYRIAGVRLRPDEEEEEA
ncbi:hypothetical protein CYMTET_14761 [Cymbomonas tetramitiformis]|uniref:Uncharacterized protein n=1 Tax=Cymbomonas tetramitiformis TaxID=36881 RepID=A0AAE0LA13_9CHLO|nr:hypothetical protein CYMTET_14761 [Cymbomonas tetramitiformis]